MTARVVDLVTMEKALGTLAEGRAAMAEAEETLQEASEYGFEAPRLRARLSEVRLQYLELAWWVDGQLSGMMEP